MIFLSREDLKRLEYLKYCIKESMRLFPPVCGNGRVLSAPTEICGFKLPEGTSLGTNIYAVHRHPDFWENPDVSFSMHLNNDVHYIQCCYHRTLTLFGLLLKGQKDGIHMPMFHSLLAPGTYVRMCVPHPVMWPLATPPTLYLRMQELYWAGVCSEWGEGDIG